MAKLRAHGNELLRISQERTWDESLDEKPDSLGNVYPISVVWERETRSYRSDGHIMLKRDYKFNPRLKFGPATQSSGWKLYRKLKKDATVTAEQFAAKMVADINTGRYTSWKIEEVSLRLQITSPSVDAVKA